jgi:hypothetical protein
MEYPPFARWNSHKKTHLGPLGAPGHQAEIGVMQGSGQASAKLMSETGRCVAGGSDKLARLLLPLTASTAAYTASDSDAQQVAAAPMPHCPQCGGCRFVLLELRTDDNAAQSDTS